MKKQLLTLAFVMAACIGSAYAFNAEKAPFDTPKTIFPTDAPAKLPTANGYDIDFCGDLYSWYSASTQSNLTYKIYVYILPEVASQLAGNQLTDLYVSFCSTNADATRQGSIFISEDLAAEPVTSTAVTIADNYNNLTIYSKYAFDTPYTIKENTGFYMGYEVRNCVYGSGGTYDYPVPVCATAPNDFCGNVEVYNASGVSIVNRTGAELDEGFNIFLKAVTVGEKKSVTDIFSIDGVTFGSFTLPVLESPDNSTAYVKITNIGSSPITSVEYTATCNNNGNTMTRTVGIYLEGNGTTGSIALPLPVLNEGRGSVDVAVTAVNGQPVGTSATFNYIVLANGGYDRKFVVEEGTGTWCGWCPRGIVGLGEMYTNHPDNFIGIAVHYSDNLETLSYSSLIYKYFEAFPSSIINRDPFYRPDPSATNLERCYQLWSTQKGAAKIDITGEFTGEKQVKVTANTEFGFSDPAADYKIAFVVLENGVAGTQTNYYAGGSYGAMGGWENYGSTKAWIYKHVARNIFDVMGIANSVPRSVTAGETMSYEYNLSLNDVKGYVENSDVVAMLIDCSTGTILNATKVKSTDFTPIPLESLAFNTTTEAIDVNGTISVSPVFTPSNATFRMLTWTSSNPDVATVDSSGKVKGIADGLATITATATNGMTASYIVSVGNSPAIGDVNNDGKYSVADVSMIVSYVLGGSPKGGIREAADVNFDGRISAADVSIVVSYILSGLEINAPEHR